VFCLLGLVLPYSQFVRWIIEHHPLNMSMFMHDPFANRIAAFFALDVIVSAIVLLSFIQSEGRRLRMRFLWLPMLGTVFIGVSLGLPLFLICGNSSSIGKPFKFETMTADDFRKLALSFPEAVESAHMHHPDFRVGGKIFATLGYPDEHSAVVQLTPDEQRDLVRGDPNVFQAVKGAWGRRGSTSIHLPAAKIEIVREALGAAWRNTVPKRLTQTR
jgi:hypothetical protein